MSLLIAYRSRYGTAEKCAGLLRDRMAASTRLVDLKRERAPDLSPHDTVIIGGSVYGGTVQREVITFCEHNRERLLEKRVGLYLCCLYQGEKARQQMVTIYPSWLVAHAEAMSSFGGEIEISALNILDRLVVRSLFGYRRDISLLDPDEVERFAHIFKAVAS